MSPFARLRLRLAPPYSLSTKMLVAASILVAVLAILYSALAYERLGRETMVAAKRWSDSVAQLVSTTNVSAFVLSDVAAIESNLQQVALLPGIDNIAIFRADGRVLTQAFKTGEEVHSSVGGQDRVTLPLQGVKTLPGLIKDQVYESWAPIETGTAYPIAWVRVQFSLTQRSAELHRLWYQSALATALLVGLVLASLHLVISHALRPICVLSNFAEQMPQHIGSQIDVEPGCVEVTQLGAALNEASRSIAEQVGRVQAIVNTAAEAIIGLDTHGFIATANPTASSFFGRPEAELLGQPLERFVPGLSINSLRDMFGGDSNYGSSMTRVVRQDFFGTRAGGTLFPVEISLGQVKQGMGLRYVCIVRDMTDEKAAQETSELYERALACSHNAVFITDARLPNQPIVYINEAFQTMIDLPAHKVLGGNMDILRGTDPHDAGILELTQAVQEARIANVTLYKQRANGQPQIAEVSLSPVRSAQGVLTHFVGIVSDVTARVKAEEAIAERRAQLDAIFSLSPDGFVLFDAQDRIVFANPAFERMTGLRWLEQKNALTLDDFETIMGDLCDSDHPYPRIQRAAENSESWQARLEMIRPQHKVLRAQFRRNTTGRSETILYFRDVTHEDAVDRMKSEFLAAAAHELRTPMVSIFGFTELLLKRKFTEERRVDMLETIHRQSGLLVKMINELLDLARIESRRGLDFEIVRHSLGDMVNTCVKGLMRADTDRQVTVALVPDASVLIDPEKMQLALNNLLSNAFKYSPMGGTVTLNARVERAGAEQFAVIEVRDQGIGMSPEQLARAFERFYRADASGNIPGTGLGLSMVKEVAELHKGKVELKSTTGQGTTASLWIPVAKDEESPSGCGLEKLAIS